MTSQEQDILSRPELSILERARRAILKVKFYDCEPELYAGEIDFYERMSQTDHWEEAEDEARAAIEAMMEEDLKARLVSIEFDKMVGAATGAGCREWFGGMDRRDGYGRFKGRGAHQFAYERAKGQVPLGLVLDHICRNRKCVNPEHLRAVTNAENVLSGVGRTAVNAAKTHCWRGHALEGDNLYITPIGGRMCRECRRIAGREFKARRRTSLSKGGE